MCVAGIFRSSGSSEEPLNGIQGWGLGLFLGNPADLPRVVSREVAVLVRMLD